MGGDRVLQEERLRGDRLPARQPAEAIRFEKPLRESGEEDGRREIAVVPDQLHIPAHAPFSAE